MAKDLKKLVSIAPAHRMLPIFELADSARSLSVVAVDEFVTLAEMESPGMNIGSIERETI